MKVILEIKDLCKYYGTDENVVRAVDHVNLRIKQGEFVTIVGKSGSGKSTLLHLIGGLDNPTAGEVWIDGKNIAGYSGEQLASLRRRKIGFIFQAYNLVPSLNVWENVVLPIGLDGRKVDGAFVKDILKTLGMEEKVRNLPNTLSGGQQQRTAIARAIAAKPSIILADEPTGNLDSKTTQEVLGLLKLTGEQFHQTIVMITHNEALSQLCDRVIHIEDGKIVDDRRDAAFSRNVIERAAGGVSDEEQ